MISFTRGLRKGTVPWTAAIWPAYWIPLLKEPSTDGLRSWHDHSRCYALYIANLTSTSLAFSSSLSQLFCLFRLAIDVSNHVQLLSVTALSIFHSHNQNRLRIYRRSSRYYAMSSLDCQLVNLELKHRLFFLQGISPPVYNISSEPFDTMAQCSHSRPDSSNKNI